MINKVYNTKFFKIFVAFIYTLLFYIGYIKFLNVYYGYAGFMIVDSRLDDILFVLLTFAICIIPAFFYKGISQISSFVTIFIYYVLYIPIIITFYLGEDNDLSAILYVQTSFLIGMCLFFLADRIPKGKKIVLPSQFNIMKIILVLTWIGIAYIAFVYRDSLQFVSYEDVYTQRSATEALGRDVFTAYFGAWLANVLIPFSATYGLFSKKYIYFFSAFLGSLIFYMSTADKAILLFPFIIFVIFKFLRNKKLNNSFSSIGLGFSTIMFGTLVLGFSLFAALFWMRTIGNGGLLTRLYYEYFTSNPNTYFSHINVVNTITHSYPYGDKSLGQVVGGKYFSDVTNANANFWATDGIASFGDQGIIFASIIFFLVLVLFNRITAGYNKIFIICVLIPFISSLLNQSLFSSLLTGGGFWIMIILSFKNMLINPYINENTNNIRSKTSIH